MFSELLDKIGDWNPQLYRELKGRFIPRNLIITIGCSLMTSLLLILMFSNSEFGLIFNKINWLVPIILVTGGVYQLSYDLAKEYQKRTLNFIAFTPQSSQKILLGKILGVPSLIYLGVALLLPLHLVSGMAYGASFLTILSIYTFWIVGCFVFYNIALFYVVVRTKENKIAPENIAGYTTGSALILGVIARSCLELLVYHSSQWYWFGLPLGEVKILAYIWALLGLSATGYWLWNAVNRRFYSRDKSLLKKSQVYQLVIFLQLWLLGFVLPGQYSSSSQVEFVGLAFAFLINSGFYITMVGILSPSRQYILDWTRYHHLERGNKSLYSELIFGEKSPSILAVALSCSITVIVWLFWVLLLPKSFFESADISRIQMIIGLILQLNVWLIYAVIAEILFLKETIKKEGLSREILVFAIAVISGLFMSWVILSLKINLPLLWTFTLVPIAVYIKGSTLTACLGLFLQLVTMVLLTNKLVGTIKQLGQSETKALLQEGRLQ